MGILIRYVLWNVGLCVAGAHLWVTSGSFGASVWGKVEARRAPWRSDFRLFPG